MTRCRILIAGSALAVLLTVMTGCSAAGSYQSSKVYDRAMNGKITREAMAYEGPARNPVIVIHGFLGAKLADNATGELVWGRFTGINSLDDSQIRSLSHPMAIGKRLRELPCTSHASGLLDRVKIRLLGVNFYLNAYDNLIDILTEYGYMPETKPLPPGKHYSSLFVFYYDWRRDIPENAARLHRFIRQKRTYMQREYKRCYGVSDYDVQFDVVAHSMGGLLIRYYLRYGNQDLPRDGSMPRLDWRGSRYIDKVALLGTPNAGYLDTFLEMTRGLELAPGAPVYPPGLVGTFPTYYQMMPLSSTRAVVYADDPKGPPVDLFNPDVWIKNRWGLADPAQDKTLQILLPNVTSAAARRVVALDHLTKCLHRARQFTRAMRIKSMPPEDVTLALFLGDAVPTTRTAAVNRKDGTITVTEYEAGDGKVLSSSARMDEREGRKWTPFENSPIKWHYVMCLRAAHMGLTNSNEFADNIQYYLLFFPTPKQERSLVYIMTEND
ncbi:MAG: hypothetical protein PHQ27_08920 [Victivallales bacterium]|nr:hypothetical protein [Victivallales bacterium]